MSWSFQPLLLATEQLSTTGYIKVYLNTSWQYKPMKIWNGTQWDKVVIKYRSGLLWITTGT